MPTKWGCPCPFASVHNRLQQLLQALAIATPHPNILRHNPAVPSVSSRENINSCSLRAYPPTLFISWSKHLQSRYATREGVQPLLERGAAVKTDLATSHPTEKQQCRGEFISGVVLKLDSFMLDVPRFVTISPAQRVYWEFHGMAREILLDWRPSILRFFYYSG